ncbi:MAG: hypothetical protein LBU17_01850 [Treponema sp.]|jgi:hypothetical protein|nr:hypothetical protein [Treponema sp.]
MKADTVNQTFLNYKVIYASLQVTKKIEESSDAVIRALHKKTPFGGKSLVEFEAQIDSAITEFNDVMVLALFAAFERELKISVQNVLNTNLNPQNSMVFRLAELTSDSIERWTMTDLLSTLRNIVDSNILGQVKQIYEYRNWVAYGKNQHKSPAINASPRFTFNLLTRFITQASAVL